MTRNTHNDRAFYQSLKNKRDFISAMPTIIQNHMPDHSIYFLTLTFTQMKRSAPYENYHVFMRYFHEKLEQRLLPRCNSSQSYKSPTMIMFPESIPAMHFHGIVMIHNQTSNRFQQKCISDQSLEYIPSIDAEKLSYKLRYKIQHPYPKAARREHIFPKKNDFFKPAYLTLASHALYQIDNEREFSKCTQYSSKNYRKHEFADDDVLLLMRPNAKSKPT